MKKSLRVVILALLFTLDGFQSKTILNAPDQQIETGRNINPRLGHNFIFSFLSPIVNSVFSNPSQNASAWVDKRRGQPTTGTSSGSHGATLPSPAAVPLPTSALPATRTDDVTKYLTKSFLLPLSDQPVERLNIEVIPLEHHVIIKSEVISKNLISNEVAYSDESEIRFKTSGLDVLNIEIPIYKIKHGGSEGSIAPVEIVSDTKAPLPEEIKGSGNDNVDPVKVNPPVDQEENDSTITGGELKTTDESSNFLKSDEKNSEVNKDIIGGVTFLKDANGSIEDPVKEISENLKAELESQDMDSSVEVISREN